MSSYTKTKIVTNMIKNAKFFADENWDKGTGWTIDTSYDGLAIRAYIGSVSSLSQNIPGVTDGSYYHLRYVINYAPVNPDTDLKLNSSGAFKIKDAQQGHEYDLSATVGMHDVEVECVDAGGLLSFEVAANTQIRFLFVQMIPDEEDVYMTIAAAVSALSGAGGTIIVENGEYLIWWGEFTSATPVPSHCSILGQGEAAIYIVKSLTILTNSNQTTGNERIVISGLTFYSLLGYGVWMYNSIPISMKKVKNCVFEDLRFVGTSNHPMTNAGLQIEGSGSDDYTCAGNIVSGCVFERIRDNDGAVGDGLRLKGYCRQTMVVNNSFNDCFNGMVLEESPENVLSGNVITGSKNYGVWVKLSDFTALQENQVTGGDGVGVFIERSSNCAVQGNVCKDNEEEGILVEGSETVGAYYNALCGNVCQGNGESGINLSADVKYANVSGNNCHDNSLYGIEEKDAASTGNNLFVGNMCHDNTNGQMLVSSGDSISANNMSE